MTAAKPAEGAPRWSARSIGTNWQHQFFYRLIRLGGRRTACGFLHFVTPFYALRRKHRERCYFYVRHRYPGSSRLKCFVHANRMFLALGRSLIDRATAGILGLQEFEICFDDSEELLRILRDGRGLILMNAHVGCWQLAMAAMKNLPARVSLLMWREEGDLDRHYFEHRGQQSPYRIIDPGGFLGGILEIMEELRAGQVVSVMGDRLFGSERQAVSVPFLGGEIRLPFSAYLIASATGAPIVALLSAKEGPSRYRLRLYQTIRVPPGLPKRPEAYAPYAAQFAQCLERYVGEHPHQFFNFYDLWS